MTPVDQNDLGLSGVMVVDLKYTAVRHNYHGAKIMLMTDASPMAIAVFSAFSKETVRRLNDLLRSIEQDYIEAMGASTQATRPAQEGDEEQVDDEGPSFR